MPYPLLGLLPISLTKNDSSSTRKRLFLASELPLLLRHESLPIKIARGCEMTWRISMDAFWTYAQNRASCLDHAPCGKQSRSQKRNGQGSPLALSDEENRSGGLASRWTYADPCTFLTSSGGNFRSAGNLVPVSAGAGLTLEAVPSHHQASVALPLFKSEVKQITVVPLHERPLSCSLPSGHMQLPNEWIICGCKAFQQGRPEGLGTLCLVSIKVIARVR